MTGKYNPSNFQKFLSYFLPISTIITVIMYLLIIQFLPASIVVYTMLIFPFILSTLEGVLGTYFYFPNRFKKVTFFILLFLAGLTIFSLYFYENYVERSIFSIETAVLIFGIFCFVVSGFYFLGRLLSSVVTSKFLKPYPPESKMIKKFVISYKSENFKTAELITTFSCLLSQLFGYSGEEEYIEDNGEILNLIKRYNSDKCVFIKLSSKYRKLFILPISLKDFIVYSCDKDATKSIKGVLSVLLKFKDEEVSDEEVDSILGSFEKITQPVLKDKLTQFKWLFIIFVSTISSILLATAIILNLQQIVNFLINILTETGTQPISIAIGGALMLLFVGLYKKICGFVKSKLFKK